MSKLYFTDAIKALYMCKEFGVNFEDKEGDIIKPIHYEMNRLFRYFPYEEMFGDFIGVLSENEKIYVAKESEHIFEPKDMDYGTTKRIVGQGFCQYSDVRGYKGWNYVSDDRKCKEPVEIIMRDGKQFFNAEND